MDWIVDDISDFECVWSDTEWIEKDQAEQTKQKIICVHAGAGMIEKQKMCE